MKKSQVWMLFAMVFIIAPFAQAEPVLDQMMVKKNLIETFSGVTENMSRNTFYMYKYSFESESLQLSPASLFARTQNFVMQNLVANQNVYQADFKVKKDNKRYDVSCLLQVIEVRDQIKKFFVGDVHVRLSSCTLMDQGQPVENLGLDKNGNQIQLYADVYVRNLTPE